jgi:AraC-like DNA-binding protein
MLFVYPFVSLSVVIVYLLYLDYITGRSANSRFWLRMVFVVPVLLGLFSLYVFLIHSPFTGSKEEFFEITKGELASLSSPSRIAYSLPMTGMYVLMGVAMIIALFLIVSFNSQDYDHSKFNTAGNRKRLLLVHSTATALALGAIFYYYADFDNRWMQWFAGPGFFFMGSMMYRIEHNNDLKEEKQSRKLELDMQLANLKNYFKEKRPWLNPDLHVRDVISDLKMNRTEFWRQMKKLTESNFNDFINAYRVEEAKRLISEGHDFEKTSNIAQQAGFNSYSTFFRAFKKVTGLTPQEYSRKHQK